MLRKAGVSGRSPGLGSRDDSFTAWVLWGSVLPHTLEVRGCSHCSPGGTGRRPWLVSHKLSAAG